MMKILASILACILCLYSSTVTTAQEHSWGVGFRVGAFNQRNAFSKKMNPDDDNPNIRSGFYYQAFVNKEMGKKKKWMIEANLGFNSFSYDYLENIPSNQPPPLYVYSSSKTNVYSIQVNLRYAFLDLPELKWKHYAGISVAAHENVTNRYSFYNTHNPDPTVIERKKSGDKLYHNFLGAEYFGKINLNKRLSVQYLLGYNFSTQVLTPMGKVTNSNVLLKYDGDTYHRFNINFGIGYQL